MTIFISYSNVNNDFAKRIKRLLEILGHEVSIDDDNIKKGIDWWRAICDEIRKNRLFFLIGSQDFFDSYVCKAELEYARQCNRSIYPIILDRKAEKELNNDHINAFKFDLKHSLESTTAFLENFSSISLSEINPINKPVPKPPAYPRSDVSELFEILHENEELSLDHQHEFSNKYLVLKSKNRIDNKNLISPGQQFLNRKLSNEISLEFRKHFRALERGERSLFRKTLPLTIILFVFLSFYVVTMIDPDIYNMFLNYLN